MERINNAERFPVRKHPRMKQYDYTTPNYYFVTMCTWQKQCLFGAAGNLNQRGKIAELGLMEIEKHFQNVAVDKSVVMPNHVHAILVLREGSADLSTVLGQYKAYVARQIHKCEPDKRIWQSSFHDHVIRNQESYEKIWLYIEANPQNWTKDCFHKDIE